MFLLIFGYVGWNKQTRLLSHSHTEESYLWSSHCFLDRKLLEEDLRLHVSSLVKLGRESDIVLTHSDATINLSGHWLNQVVSLLLNYNSNFTHFTSIASSWPQEYSGHSVFSATFVRILTPECFLGRWRRRNPFKNGSRRCIEGFAVLAAQLGAEEDRKTSTLDCL